MDTLPDPRAQHQRAREAALEAYSALGRAIAQLDALDPDVQELDEARHAVAVALDALRRA